MSIERIEPGVEVVPHRRTIITALPLKQAARQRLAELLDARVIDVREPCDDPELVLTPACSPQLIGALGRRFPGARIVVVELDDWEFDIELPGPVKRLLRNGADAYVLADSIDELATKLASRPPVAQPDPDEVEPRELTSSPTVDDLVAAMLRKSLAQPSRQPVDDD